MMVAFQVALDGYSGPLDLLLLLVRRREVDVLEVALSRIAQAYLEAMQQVSDVDIDAAGDFLVLLSSLMELKSQLLIPGGDDAQAEAADTAPARTELVRQLLEYKRFKEAGALLWERARAQQRRLARVVGDAPPGAPVDQPIRELELWDLVSAFSRLMKENVVAVAERIQLDPTPVAVYMDRLEQLVLASAGATLRELMGRSNTRSQLVGKFLALLELIKSRRVWIELGEGPDEIRILPPRTEEPLLAPLAAVEPAAGSIPLADPSPPPDACIAPAEKSVWSDDAPPLGDAAAAPDERNSAWDDFESILDSDPPASEPSQARMARLDELWPGPDHTDPTSEP